MDNHYPYGYTDRRRSAIALANRFFIGHKLVDEKNPKKISPFNSVCHNRFSPLEPFEINKNTCNQLIKSLPEKRNMKKLTIKVVHIEYEIQLQKLKQLFALGQFKRNGIILKVSIGHFRDPISCVKVLRAIFRLRLRLEGIKLEIRNDMPLACFYELKRIVKHLSKRKDSCVSIIGLITDKVHTLGLWKVPKLALWFSKSVQCDPILIKYNNLKALGVSLSNSVLESKAWIETMILISSKKLNQEKLEFLSLHIEDDARSSSDDPERRLMSHVAEWTHIDKIEIAVNTTLNDSHLCFHVLEMAYEEVSKPVVLQMADSAASFSVVRGPDLRWHTTILKFVRIVPVEIFQRFVEKQHRLRSLKIDIHSNDPVPLACYLKSMRDLVNLRIFHFKVNPRESIESKKKVANISSEDIEGLVEFVKNSNALKDLSVSLGFIQACSEKLENLIYAINHSKSLQTASLSAEREGGEGEKGPRCYTCIVIVF